MDPRQYVRPGQRLQIAATQINALNAMMRPNMGVKADAAPDFSAPYTWVYARNFTGADVPRWQAMGIGGLDVIPSGYANARSTVQFESMPILTGIDPASTSPRPTGSCVAIEPIALGAIGRVAVAGVVQVKAADVGNVIGASVLWKDTEWALILFGGEFIRLGRISISWTKGTIATVTQLNGDGTAISGNPTFSAINHFITLTVPSGGTKKVACGRVAGTWILIAAEC